MPVVELRQYTLQPGRREELIDLFEREFVESQEALGIELIGQFRDLDDPDRFVWLRGFPDMVERRRALEAFYGGPVWRTHREAANATMVDSDDVLLLRPADGEPGFRLAPRAPAGPTQAGPGRVFVGIHPLAGPDDPLPGRFPGTGAASLRNAGATSVVTLVTEPAANTFPRLPVREGGRVLVWLAVFPDPSQADAAARGLSDQPVQRLRLEPTARSRLRGRAPDAGVASHGQTADEG